MNPERYRQVKQLFQSVLELAPEARAAFLAEACQGDASLQADVESLLVSHGQASGFIETPAGASAPELLPPIRESRAGQRVGAYKLLREVGRGGMGAAYLAVRADDQFQKRVAIKLVKRGMDTDFFIQRFRNERQILASLDHPNIARLLDGGATDEGLPFFVMEYVEGEPIDRYCDANRLTTVDRLKLFRTVCSAVQYAHQNLVVHRDIKPNNILVTAEGVPKLLDFGIAKLLNANLSGAAVEPTVTAQRMMTPDYASPEQILGAPLTTSSDVYSLGVLLYRLLTGHPPYRFKTTQPQEIERVVCETEPEKPSTAIARQEDPVKGARERRPDPEKLRRQLAGDLDNIILMALRKEPQRRYASAAEFSDDIGRHLDGLPVRARQDTFRYRATKFVRRHTVAVAAAALVTLTLVGGLIGIAWQARVAGEQRAKAEGRFNEVRKLANSLVFQLHDQIAELPGSTRARETLVGMALEYLDRLANEAGDDPSLQRELIMAYQKVGEVRGNPTNANLGDTAGALASYQKAMALANALVKAHPEDRQTQRTLAILHEKMGDLQSWTGHVDAAVGEARTALATFKTLADADPSAKARQSVAISHIKLGDTLGHPSFPNIGDRAGALEQYRQSLALWKALAAADPANDTTRRYLGLIHERIGAMQRSTGQLAESLDSYRESLRLRESFLADHAANTNARRDVAIAYEKIADVLLASDDTATALEHYRKAFAMFEALAAADPKNADASRSLAIEYDKIAAALAKTGDVAGALDHNRKSLGIREALSAAAPTNVHVRRDLAASYDALGDHYTLLASKGTQPAAQRSEHWRQARSWYQRSLTIWLDLRKQNALQSPDRGRPDEIAGKIARCDAALEPAPR